LGWHVPTDAEWTTLTTYVGGESIAGGKLKEPGLTHWQNPNTVDDNNTGFTALPGGIRDFDGAFDYIGDYGYWWTSSAVDSSDSWYRFMFYSFTDCYSTHFNKKSGFSVRCVKDN
jgi:uncharacterized protein (TIGR02145 family)